MPPLSDTPQSDANWTVGDRVRNRPKFAGLYSDSAWGEKLARPRVGTVVEVPLAAATTGSGTILIEWDSLTGLKKNAADWQIWLHSDLVEKVQ